MGSKGTQSAQKRSKVDVTVVQRGQLAQMARSNARPSQALQAAIDRAASRKR
ncbi:hypothetical protein [Nocardia pseudovaccinii]|uniref:hypothetical protein n=1 Tax=Nocardia pseudovaccinii TaxID=189540 RepID=UPI0012F4B2B2|nr:hypothetical protein [Nocardia pseudovaccinii]